MFPDDETRGVADGRAVAEAPQDVLIDNAPCSANDDVVPLDLDRAEPLWLSHVTMTGDEIEKKLLISYRGLSDDLDALIHKARHFDVPALIATYAKVAIRDVQTMVQIVEDLWKHRKTGWGETIVNYALAANAGEATRPDNQLSPQEAYLLENFHLMIDLVEDLSLICRNHARGLDSTREDLLFAKRDGKDLIPDQRMWSVEYYSITEKLVSAVAKARRRLAYIRANGRQYRRVLLRGDVPEAKRKAHGAKPNTSTDEARAEAFEQNVRCEPGSFFDRALDVPLGIVAERDRGAVAAQNITLCGARTLLGPCRNAAEQGRRRCRLHGGAVGSGAPKNNRNACRHRRYAKIAKNRSIAASL